MLLRKKGNYPIYVRAPIWMNHHDEVFRLNNIYPCIYNLFCPGNRSKHLPAISLQIPGCTVAGLKCCGTADRNSLRSRSNLLPASVQIDSKRSKEYLRCDRCEKCAYNSM